MVNGGVDFLVYHMNFIFVQYLAEVLNKLFFFSFHSAKRVRNRCYQAFTHHVDSILQYTFAGHFVHGMKFICKLHQLPQVPGKAQPHPFPEPIMRIVFNILGKEKRIVQIAVSQIRQPRSPHFVKTELFSQV